MDRTDLDLYFDGRLSNLRSVASLIQEVCRSLALDETTSYHIELAVVEAITNCIRHAFGEESSRPMHVVTAVKDDSLLIRVSDRGRPVKLELPPRGRVGSVPELLQEGGRGLFLICSLMDRVEQVSDAEGNTLVMTKALDRA